MHRTHDADELVEQIVALQRVRRALEGPEEQRRLARVIRQLRRRLEIGVPKHAAARALGVSPQALDRWVRAGLIPVVKKPNSSRALIDTEALLVLAEEVERLRGIGPGRALARAVKDLAAEARLPRRLRPNQSARELRYEFLHSSPADRVRSAINISETGYALAATARTHDSMSASDSDLPGPYTPLRVYDRLRVLCEHEVGFVVIGGLAVSLHGYTRGTKDIDVVADPDEETLARLWDAISSIDARAAEFGDPEAAEIPVELTRQDLIDGVEEWTLYTRLGRLDLKPSVEDAAGEIPYEELRESGERVDLDEIGHPIWFASLDHLIAMKEHAGRDFDRIDLTAIRMAQGLEGD